MTLGEFGSTLNDELNRLANGGTYRTMGNMVDDALAAKQWANRENISPYSTDTVGILNEIAGLGLDKRNWLDFNGVCNYIAGTTGLPAAAALRQVYATTDLLTGVASYYVDATQATNWGSLGYVYLDGSAGNTLIVANAQAPTVTGDFEAIVTMAADDWTPSAGGPIFSNWGSADPNRKYNLQLNSNGTLSFQWTPNGNYASRLTSTSTVAPTVADGATLSIKVTLDVDNGASGNDTKFFTSTNNGATWTQLGSTITKAGTTSINGTGTADFRVARWLDDNSSVAGKYYQVIIKNGIDGTTLLNINIANDYKAANLTEFTATTGQLVTVAGTPGNTVVNSGAAGSLLPTTLGSSTAADSNDPKFLDFTGTNYVYLPGSASNYLSVADSDALDITGDIDIRAQIAMDDWTQGAAGDYNFVVAKWTATNATRSYVLGLRGSGVLNLGWVETGGTNIRLVDSTVAPTISDGAPLWIRATLDVDNGSSQYEVKFFTSNNGTTWTQLGSTITGTTGISSIQATTTAIAIGSITGGASNLATSKVFRAQIFNGIDGTKVLDVDTSTLQTGADAYIVPVTYSGAAGARFTGSGLALPGTNGNNATSPDSAALDITGDIDLRVKVAYDNYNPGGDTQLLEKMTASASTSSYRFIYRTTGALGIEWSNGTTTIFKQSNANLSLTNGQTIWLRATLDVNNGASGNDVQFFSSTDGSTWTQLGTTVTTAGVTSINAGTANLIIGEFYAGGNNRSGTFYQAQIRNGIDGTVAFNANFEGVPADSLRMTESSSNAAVVTLNTTRYCTINRSSSGRKTVAVTQPTWLFGTDDYMEVNNRYMSSGTYLYLPGVTGNYASAPDSNALDITGDIDIRLKLAMDDWTPSTTQTILGKWSGTQRAYYVEIPTNGAIRIYWSSTGTGGSALTSNATITAADGATLWIRAVIDVDNGAGGTDGLFYTSTDGTTWTQLGTTITSAGTASIFSGTAPLEIGTINGGVNGPLRGKVFRAQVLNGINGTVAFDANFETSITSLNQASFTESSANAATVTINRSGSTFRSAGITTAGYLYPGATNTFTASATDFLNFGAADSFTVLSFQRIWNPIGNLRPIIGKVTSGGYLGGPSYGIFTLGNTQAMYFEISSTGGIRAFINGPTYTAGTLQNTVEVFNNTNKTLSGYQNGTLIGSNQNNSLTTMSNILPLRIGAYSDTTSFNPDFEFIAGAVFRQALTARQITQISNYFARREAYL